MPAVGITDGPPPCTNLTEILVLIDDNKKAAIELQQMREKLLEKVAIVNALQLEAEPDPRALSRFNYDGMSSLKSLNLSICAL